MIISNGSLSVVIGRFVALAAMGALSANVASAQCSWSANTADQSTPGNARLQATTTQQGCIARTAIVIGWISGGSTSCITGAPWVSGHCRQTDGSANAVINVSHSGCGTWDGVSDHTYQQDGTTYTIELGRSTALSAGSCGGDGGCQENKDDCGDSPIIVSLAANAKYKLTSPELGVVFDIDGTGVLKTVAWTEPNSDVAFLAIDLDGDGRITSGKELFGNHTIPGLLNGFDALAHMALASNGGVKRGSVSSDDPLFSKLLLWTDRNHNGISETDELRPAADVISDIGLGYNVSRREDNFGNQFRFRGHVHLRTGQGRNKARSAKEDGERTRAIYDVFFKTLQ